MDFLKAEMARKKRQIQDSGVLAGDKKYFKRGDLAAKQEEEYWKKHKRWKGENDEDSMGNDPGTNSADSGAEDEEKKMHPRKEVIRRMRERDEPIRLFGESDFEAFQRLKRLEMLQPEVNKGFKNDMKAAMDQVDQDYLNEILRESGADPTKVNDVKVKDDGKTFEDIQKMAEKLGTGDDGLDSEVILNYFKLILKVWGDALNQRPREEKQIFKGKLASATHSQTVTYIKPLMRKLKRKELSLDILGCLADVVKQLLDKHYINANDAYLQMAIGNAPWPIGVTMVGIHARTGREKIFDRNVAHVLNDETQRKYIQAVKRLITYAQKYFPTDPSRSVNFEGNIH